MKEITYKLIFTKEEAAGIRNLQEKGLTKGISYKIDRGTDCGITCFCDGVLTGFMTVDCFDGKDIESAAIIDNIADWDNMADALITQARELKAERILFICDPHDTGVSQKLKSWGLRSSFSEYRMELDTAAYSPAVIDDISIKKAIPSDATYIKMLDEEVFGRSIDRISPQDLNNTIIIIRNHQPVGKLRAVESDGIYGIYGVIVDSRLRGKGIGAQALTLLLDKLQALDAKTIYLEVDSSNPAAFHLYQKLGFKVTSEFRYYPYKLPV